jgi:hypothetical protein
MRIGRNHVAGFIVFSCADPLFLDFSYICQVKIDLMFSGPFNSYFPPNVQV